MPVDVHGSQFMALATPTRVPVSTNWPALHDSLLQANPAVTSKSTDARRWCPLQPRATQLSQFFFVARTAPATCTSSRYEQKSIGGASFWWTCRIFVLAFFSAFGSWVALKIVVQWTVCNGNQWISWWLRNLNKVQRGTSAPQITT